MCRAALISILLGVAGGEAVAQERDASRQIERAEAYWADLDYELVIEAADAALADPRVTSEQQIEALRLKGSALVVLNRNDEARAVFEGIFAVDPTFDLPPGTSPRILEVFRPAKERWRVEQESRLARELGPSLSALRTEVRLAPRARGGLPILIELALEDPGGLARSAVLYYRKEGTRGYSTLSVTAAPGNIELEIPGVFTASEISYRLELYLEILHESGISLRRVGSPMEPRVVAVQAGSVPAPRSIFRRWWFWTAVAATAVAVPFLVDQARDVGPQTIVGKPVRP